MVRSARCSKFSNITRDRQLANSDLHFVNYRQLERSITSGRGALPVDTVAFVEAVNAEICLVNTCFERRRLELLQSIAGLRHMLIGRSCVEEIDSGSNHFWQRARACLVEVLDGLTRLREYAVHNCLAVVKVHRRWSKQAPSDVQDKNLQAVIQHLQASGPDEWLGQLRYYDGLEFAELYIAIESLSETPLLRQCSSQGGPDRPMPKSQSFDEEAAAHTVVSSGSDPTIATSCPVASSEPELAATPKEVSIRCIACLSEIVSSTAKTTPSPSASTVIESEASSTAQFGCGHRLCQTCFGLGRNAANATIASGGSAKRDAQAECAICRNCKAFGAKDSEGIRSFRGVLLQFLQNLFMAEDEALCIPEQPVVGVRDPAAAALAKHVSSCCEMSNI